MISKQTLDFLRELKQNNNKPWFDENRKVYESSRAEFIALTQSVIDGLAAFDADIAVSGLMAKDCIMRINRDVRFSLNKQPYKTNFFAFIKKGGRKVSEGAGYYLHLEPGGESFVGAGIYMPPNPILNKIRADIDINYHDWFEVAKSEGLLSVYPNGVETESKLVRPPKGFDVNHPAIDYIKYKSFYTLNHFKDEDFTKESILESLITCYLTAKPLVDFINRALSD